MNLKHFRLREECEELRLTEKQALGWLPWSAWDYYLGAPRKILRRNREGFLVAYMLYSTDWVDREITIAQLIVRRGYRRRGIATELVTEIEEWATTMSFHRLKCRVKATLEANLFWRAAGFRLVGRSYTMEGRGRWAANNRRVNRYEKELP